MTRASEDNLEQLAVRAAMVLNNATRELADIIEEIRRRRDASKETLDAGQQS